MTQNQVTIMWLGIILIALNLVNDLAGFKNVIFNSGTNANTTATASPVISNGTITTPPNALV